MICTEKKAIDVKNKDCTVEGSTENYVKLTKIPEWLQYTDWKVGGPASYISNYITVAADFVNIKAIVKDLDNKTSGLTSFGVDTRLATAITSEFADSISYSFGHSNALNNKIEVVFKIDEGGKTGTINLLDSIIMRATFPIIKENNENK